MTWLPAHADAVRDPALKGRPLEVYDQLIYRLESAVYTPLPVRAIARELGLKRKTVSVALQVLCANGYLEWRPTSTRTRAYRLCLNRRAKIPA
jgi:DNA-binding MarR family transcriptional regulator